MSVAEPPMGIPPLVGEICIAGDGRRLYKCRFFACLSLREDREDRLLRRLVSRTGFEAICEGIF